MPMPFSHVLIRTDTSVHIAPAKEHAGLNLQTANDYLI